MDYFYKSLSVFAFILAFLSLLSNLGILVYIAFSKMYRSKTMFIVFFSIFNILILITWDYTNFIDPFFDIQYLKLNHVWCSFIFYMQYWILESHSCILVLTILRLTILNNLN
jgi:hypothetical protein